MTPSNAPKTAEQKIREAACDAWIELRYQGVDGPAFEVKPYVDTIAKAIEAARVDALEEAAARCDREAAELLRISKPGSVMSKWASDITTSCATWIRALKGGGA